MGRQAGRIMRRLAFSAVLMLSTLLIVTPFALAQDSEQSIPQTQIAFGLPDVVADELPAVDDSVAATAPELPKEPERKDAGARTALKLQVSFELTSDGL